MSATSSTTDPVQTIVDLLSGTAQADYPNGTKPDPIELYWESDMRTKMNRPGNAVYCRSPQDATQDEFSGDSETKLRGETVIAELWSVDTTNHTDITTDITSILEDYWEDHKNNTKWNRIRPQGEDDRRAENIVRRTDHYVTAIRIELERENSIGT